MNRVQTADQHPAWGLLSLLAAAIAATVILLGVPWLFGELLQIPAFAEMSGATIESLFTLATFGLLALVAWLAIHLYAIAVPLGPRKGTVAAGGIAIGAVSLAAALALSAIAGTAHQGIPAEQGWGLFVLQTLLIGMQSGAEEYYFRGWVQSDLQRRWGAGLALGLTAILFAALHFIAAASEPASFVTMLLGGVLFGLLYQKSGSFLLPWGAHFGWNWAEEMVFGLYPNPGSGTFGTLINVDLSGSPWWGGSPEGLNASLPAIIVLVAVIAAVFAWPSGQGSKLRPNPARG